MQWFKNCNNYREIQWKRFQNHSSCKYKTQNDTIRSIFAYVAQSSSWNCFLLSDFEFNDRRHFDIIFYHISSITSRVHSYCMVCNTDDPSWIEVSRRITSVHYCFVIISVYVCHLPCHAYSPHLFGRFRDNHSSRRLHSVNLCHHWIACTVDFLFLAVWTITTQNTRTHVPIRKYVVLY